MSKLYQIVKYFQDSLRRNSLLSSWYQPSRYLPFPLLEGNLVQTNIKCKKKIFNCIRCTICSPGIKFDTSCLIGIPNTFEFRRGISSKYLTPEESTLKRELRKTADTSKSLAIIPIWFRRSKTRRDRTIIKQSNQNENSVEIKSDLTNPKHKFDLISISNKTNSKIKDTKENNLYKTILYKLALPILEGKSTTVKKKQHHNLKQKLNNLVSNNGIAKNSGTANETKEIKHETDDSQPTETESQNKTNVEADNKDSFGVPDDDPNDPNTQKSKTGDSENSDKRDGRSRMGRYTQPNAVNEDKQKLKVKAKQFEKLNKPEVEFYIKKLANKYGKNNDEKEAKPKRSYETNRQRTVYYFNTNDKENHSGTEKPFNMEAKNKNFPKKCYRDFLMKEKEKNRMTSRENIHKIMMEVENQKFKFEKMKKATIMRKGHFNSVGKPQMKFEEANNNIQNEIKFNTKDGYNLKSNDNNQFQVTKDIEYNNIFRRVNAKLIKNTRIIGINNEISLKSDLNRKEIDDFKITCVHPNSVENHKILEIPQKTTSDKSLDIKLSNEKKTISNNLSGKHEINYKSNQILDENRICGNASSESSNNKQLIMSENNEKNPSLISNNKGNSIKNVKNFVLPLEPAELKLPMKVKEDMKTLKNTECVAMINGISINGDQGVNNTKLITLSNSISTKEYKGNKLKAIKYEEKKLYPISDNKDYSKKESVKNKEYLKNNFSPNEFTDLKLLNDKKENVKSLKYNGDKTDKVDHQNDNNLKSITLSNSIGNKECNKNMLKVIKNIENEKNDLSVDNEENSKKESTKNFQKFFSQKEITDLKLSNDNRENVKSLKHNECKTAVIEDQGQKSKKSTELTGPNIIDECNVKTLKQITIDEKNTNFLGNKKDLKKDSLTNLIHIASSGKALILKLPTDEKEKINFNNDCSSKTDLKNINHNFTDHLNISTADKSEKCLTVVKNDEKPFISNNEDTSKKELLKNVRNKEIEKEDKEKKISSAIDKKLTEKKGGFETKHELKEYLGNNSSNEMKKKKIMEFNPTTNFLNSTGKKIITRNYKMTQFFPSTETDKNKDLTSKANGVETKLVFNYLLPKINLPLTKENNIISSKKEGDNNSKLQYNSVPSKFNNLFLFSFGLDYRVSKCPFQSGQKDLKQIPALKKKYRKGIPLTRNMQLSSSFDQYPQKHDTKSSINLESYANSEKNKVSSPSSLKSCPTIIPTEPKNLNKSNQFENLTKHLEKTSSSRKFHEENIENICANSHDKMLPILCSSKNKNLTFEEIVRKSLRQDKRNCRSSSSCGVLVDTKQCNSEKLMRPPKQIRRIEEPKDILDSQNFSEEYKGHFINKNLDESSKNARVVINLDSKNNDTNERRVIEEDLNLKTFDDKLKLKLTDDKMLKKVKVNDEYTANERGDHIRFPSTLLPVVYSEKSNKLTCENKNLQIENVDNKANDNLNPNLNLIKKDEQAGKVEGEKNQISDSSKEKETFSTVNFDKQFSNELNHYFSKFVETVINKNVDTARTDVFLIQGLNRISFLKVLYQMKNSKPKNHVIENLLESIKKTSLSNHCGSENTLQNLVGKQMELRIAEIKKKHRQKIPKENISIYNLLDNTFILQSFNKVSFNKECFKWIQLEEDKTSSVLSCKTGKELGNSQKDKNNTKLVNAIKKYKINDGRLFDKMGKCERLLENPNSNNVSFLEVFDSQSPIKCIKKSKDCDDKGSQKFTIISSKHLSFYSKYRNNCKPLKDNKKNMIGDDKYIRTEVLTPLDKNFPQCELKLDKTESTVQTFREIFENNRMNTNVNENKQERSNESEKQQEFDSYKKKQLKEVKSRNDKPTSISFDGMTNNHNTRIEPEVMHYIRKLQNRQKIGTPNKSFTTFSSHQNRPHQKIDDNVIKSEDHNNNQKNVSEVKVERRTYDPKIKENVKIIPEKSTHFIDHKKLDKPDTSNFDIIKGLHGGNFKYLMKVIRDKKQDSKQPSKENQDNELKKDVEKTFSKVLLKEINIIPKTSYETQENQCIDMNNISLSEALNIPTDLLINDSTFEIYIRKKGLPSKDDNEECIHNICQICTIEQNEASKNIGKCNNGLVLGSDNAMTIEKVENKRGLENRIFDPKQEIIKLNNDQLKENVSSDLNETNEKMSGGNCNIKSSKNLQELKTIVPGEGINSYKPENLHINKVIDINLRPSSNNGINTEACSTEKENSSSIIHKKIGHPKKSKSLENKKQQIDMKIHNNEVKTEWKNKESNKPIIENISASRQKYADSNSEIKVIKNNTEMASTEQSMLVKSPKHSLSNYINNLTTDKINLCRKIAHNNKYNILENNKYQIEFKIENEVNDDKTFLNKNVLSNKKQNEDIQMSIGLTADSIIMKDKNNAHTRSTESKYHESCTEANVNVAGRYKFTEHIPSGSRCLKNSNVEAATSKENIDTNQLLKGGIGSSYSDTLIISKPPVTESNINTFSSNHKKQFEINKDRRVNSIINKLSNNLRSKDVEKKIYRPHETLKSIIEYERKKNEEIIKENKPQKNEICPNLQKSFNIPISSTPFTNKNNLEISNNVIAKQKYNSNFQSLSLSESRDVRLNTSCRNLHGLDGKLNVDTPKKNDDLKHFDVDYKETKTDTLKNDFNEREVFFLYKENKRGKKRLIANLLKNPNNKNKYNSNIKVDPIYILRTQPKSEGFISQTLRSSNVGKTPPPSPYRELSNEQSTNNREITYNRSKSRTNLRPISPAQHSKHKMTKFHFHKTDSRNQRNETKKNYSNRSIRPTVNSHLQHENKINIPSNVITNREFKKNSDSKLYLFDNPPRKFNLMLPRRSPKKKQTLLMGRPPIKLIYNKTANFKPKVSQKIDKKDYDCLLMRSLENMKNGMKYALPEANESSTGKSSEVLNFNKLQNSSLDCPNIDQNNSSIKMPIRNEETKGLEKNVVSETGFPSLVDSFVANMKEKLQTLPTSVGQIISPNPKKTWLEITDLVKYDTLLKGSNSMKNFLKISPIRRTSKRKKRLNRTDNFGEAMSLEPMYNSKVKQKSVMNQINDKSKRINTSTFKQSKNICHLLKYKTEESKRTCPQMSYSEVLNKFYAGYQSATK